MYPKAHFVTIFAKPAGRPLVMTMLLISRKIPGSNSRGIWARIRPANLRSLIFSTPGTAGLVLFNFRRVTIVSSKYSGGCSMTQANLSETLFKPRFKHPEPRR